MTRMKDSGIEWIGEVPEEWGIKKLSQSFSEHKLKNLGNIEQNLLSLSYGKIVRKSIKSSVGLLPESFETYNIIDSNDIVLRLTDLQNDKRSLRTGLANERGIITSAYLTIRLIDGNDSAKYYHYLLHSYDKCKVFYNFGGGVRQGGTWDDLSVLKMIVPPKDEQTKIADFLDKKVAQLDKVKSLLEEQIKTLEDYRQSLIYETVTKGLDKTVALKDSGVDWIGQIPEGWGVKPIKYCSRFQRGFGFPVELQGNDDGEIPFYKVSDLRGNSDEISISKNYVDLQTAKQNAWVIVPSGAIIAPVIGAALLNNNRKISTVPFISDNNTLAIIPNNKNKYFYYLFKVIDMNWFNNSSTIPAVNISKLANQIVPTPKEEEQKQIADFLEVQIIKIDKLIEIKQKQINNINQQRQTLIYDVVTGKRRV